MRRAGAIKCSPSYADKGDHTLLKASWTTGGKARMILVRTADQRDILESAHRRAGRESMTSTVLGNSVLLLDINGSIGPATSDYVATGFARAWEMGSPLVILRMDTPGGLDAAMRDIVKEWSAR